MLRAMARSTIHYLRKRGLTRTAIAGQVGCERHTVARVLAQPVDHRYARPPRSSTWAHWEPPPPTPTSGRTGREARAEAASEEGDGVSRRPPQQGEADRRSLLVTTRGRWGVRYGVSYRVVSPGIPRDAVQGMGCSAQDGLHRTSQRGEPETACPITSPQA